MRIPSVGCLMQLWPRHYQRELHDATKCAKITVVLGKEYEGQICSIARSLELVGERWTLLVIREVFNGHRRFSQMQRSLITLDAFVDVRLRSFARESIFSGFEHNAVTMRGARPLARDPPPKF